MWVGIGVGMCIEGWRVGSGGLPTALWVQGLLRSPSQTNISAPKSMEKQATLSTEAHAQPPNGPRVRSGQASPPHVSPGGE